MSFKMSSKPNTYGQPLDNSQMAELDGGKALRHVLLLLLLALLSVVTLRLTATLTGHLVVSILNTIATVSGLRTTTQLGLFYPKLVLIIITKVFIFSAVTTVSVLQSIGSVSVLYVSISILVNLTRSAIEASCAQTMGSTRRSLLRWITFSPEKLRMDYRSRRRLLLGWVDVGTGFMCR